MIIKVAKRISSFYISVISLNYNFGNPDFLFVFLDTSLQEGNPVGQTKRRR